MHAAQAGSFLPRIGAIFATKGVQMRCCPGSKAILASMPCARVVNATEADWGEEYRAPIISIKQVASLDEAGGKKAPSVCTSGHDAVAERASRTV